MGLGMWMWNSFVAMVAISNSNPKSTSDSNTDSFSTSGPVGRSYADEGEVWGDTDGDCLRIEMGSSLFSGLVVVFFASGSARFIIFYIPPSHHISVCST
ncbi:hypothetical protein F5879DRAFT_933575 [Lentinula edodes]|nr:hypothetical protein F5879DRAFT_933575 [Lentinula edodes]